MRSGLLGVGAIVAVGAMALVVVATTVAGSKAAEYAVSRDGGYETKTLLSVGDVVRETSNRKQKYQMVGIPDGLGAVKESRFWAIRPIPIPSISRRASRRK